MVAELPRRKVDMVTRMKIRSLYLYNGLDPKEIAEQTQIPVAAIHKLVGNAGWSAQRSRLKREIQAKADARSAAEVEGIVEAVAIKSEEMGLRSLDEAGDILDAKVRSDFWAKDLQSVSQAAKNFIGLARQARGLDTSENQAGNTQSILFVSLERVRPREEKTVEPIHELNTPLSLAEDNAKSGEDGAF